MTCRRLRTGVLRFPSVLSMRMYHQQCPWCVWAMARDARSRIELESARSASGVACCSCWVLGSVCMRLQDGRVLRAVRTPPLSGAQAPRTWAWAGGVATRGHRGVAVPHEHDVSRAVPPAGRTVRLGRMLVEAPAGWRLPVAQRARRPRGCN
eukprot:4531335-Prymnesium_polylepis.2